MMMSGICSIIIPEVIFAMLFGFSYLPFLGHRLLDLLIFIVAVSLKNIMVVLRVSNIRIGNIR